MRYSSTRKFLIGLFVASFLLIASGAQAASVIVDDNGSAIRIENLEVSSGGAVVGLFNVDFLWTSAEAIYGSPPGGDFDFESLATALDARDAVNAALNDYNANNNPIEDVDAVDVAPNRANFFLIGFEYTAEDPPDTQVLNVFGRYNGEDDEPPEQWVAGGGVSLLANAEISYADFTLVPVPAAVWLFGSALGLLGWIRRRAA